MTERISPALVTDLLARQSHAIDEGDAAAWAATYTPDGSFFSPTYGDAIVGTENLIRFAEGVYRDLRADGIQQRHWLNNVVVDDDTATAHSYLLIIRTGPDGNASLLRHVTAHDRLAFHDGELRVRAREVRRDA